MSTIMLLAKSTQAAGAATVLVVEDFVTQPIDARELVARTCACQPPVLEIE